MSDASLSSVTEVFRYPDDGRDFLLDSDGKTRTFTFVFWPDSVDVDSLRSLFMRSGYAIAMSPLHDRDVKKVVSHDGDSLEENEELVKPHYHVLLRFRSPRYLQPVRKLVTKMLRSCWCVSAPPMADDYEYYVKPVPDFDGMVRYLCHLDTPQKALYQVNEVQTFGFIDVSALFAKSVADDVHNYAWLMSYIRERPECSYYQVMNACLDSGDMGLLRSLTRYSYTIKAYIDARNYERQLVKDKMKLAEKVFEKPNA